jgi:hypothetical protein
MHPITPKPLVKPDHTASPAPFGTEDGALGLEPRPATAAFDQPGHEFDQQFDDALDDAPLPPLEGMDLAPSTGGAAAASPGGESMFGALTGGELDCAFDALPPTPGDGGAGMAAMEAVVQQRRVARAAAGAQDGARARAASKARGAAVAVDVREGRAATQLDAASIRSLLADRAPLMKQVGACMCACMGAFVWLGGFGDRWHLGCYECSRAGQLITNRCHAYMH